MLDKNRVDLYSLIHKAQRVHLFALSSQIARADLQNNRERAEIKQKLGMLIDHLIAHAAHEATFIHPLYAEVGELAEILGDEHEELEENLELLEDILDQDSWDDLYAEFNRFIALYLIHQDQEESAQSDILWKNFDDKRLAQVMNSFRAQRTQEESKEDLEFILPCLNISELTKFFTTIKSEAEAPVFDNICALAQDFIGQERLIEVKKLLA
jgi:hypothetical protein